MPQALTTGETPSRSYAVTRLAPDDAELTQPDDGRARAFTPSARVSAASARWEAERASGGVGWKFPLLIALAALGALGVAAACALVLLPRSYRASPSARIARL